MTRKLIINADDFGVSEDIDKGIIECYDKGAVTDISLLAVGDSFTHAVRLAKEKNISKIGIHLALTGGFRALSPVDKISSLVDEKGMFPGSFPALAAKLCAGFVAWDVPLHGPHLPRFRSRDYAARFFSVYKLYFFRIQRQHDQPGAIRAGIAGGTHERRRQIPQS